MDETEKKAAPAVEPEAANDAAAAAAAAPLPEEAAPDAAPVEAPVEVPDPAAPDDGDDSLEVATAEIAALNDRLMRVLAEGENFRRRAQREREDATKFSIAGFARDMLAVADNLRRAIDSLPEGATAEDSPLDSYHTGVAMTERDLLATLERHGIKRIEPLGEKFDHDLHEALFEVPTSDAEPGTVVQVMETGYVLHDRLLRAARVGLAKALPAADDEPQHIDTTA